MYVIFQLYEGLGAIILVIIHAPAVPISGHHRPSNAFRGYQNPAASSNDNLRAENTRMRALLFAVLIVPLTVGNSQISGKSKGLGSYMSQGLQYDLLSVIKSSFGNAISVYMVVATK